MSAVEPHYDGNGGVLWYTVEVDGQRFSFDTADGDRRYIGGMIAAWNTFGEYVVKHPGEFADAG